MLIGHVAVSVLEHRYVKAELAPVVIAGVFPDIVDKTACQILHLTPSGRMYGHTLLGVILTTGIVGLIWGKRTAGSWALGYLSHLVGDIGYTVPWFYPFVQYTFKPSPSLMEILLHKLTNPLSLGLELGLCLWAGLAMINKMGQTQKQGSSPCDLTKLLKIRYTMPIDEDTKNSSKTFRKM